LLELVFYVISMLPLLGSRLYAIFIYILNLVFNYINSLMLLFKSSKIKLFNSVNTINIYSINKLNLFFTIFYMIIIFNILYFLFIRFNSYYSILFLGIFILNKLLSNIQYTYWGCIYLLDLNYLSYIIKHWLKQGLIKPFMNINDLVVRLSLLTKKIYFIFSLT